MPKRDYYTTDHLQLCYKCRKLTHYVNTCSSCLRCLFCCTCLDRINRIGLRYGLWHVRINLLGDEIELGAVYELHRYRNGVLETMDYKVMALSKAGYVEEFSLVDMSLAELWPMRDALIADLESKEYKPYVPSAGRGSGNGAQGGKQRDWLVLGPKGQGAYCKSGDGGKLYAAVAKVQGVDRWKVGCELHTDYTDKAVNEAHTNVIAKAGATDCVVEFRLAPKGIEDVVKVKFPSDFKAAQRSVYGYEGEPKYAESTPSEEELPF